ncbi:helix-turn-helix domain-containing protein [Streptomyces sp. NBC_00102]|uniref:helix-turn-helix domain-containing protein n=1 Tax=Streptomyces sp. NBC_00102 TaxID=2975652 RepID=UPI002259B3F9|nr:helix-turn-helix domain-containing protein [Streptomyces sp. NBC_00102]MCX5399226.1 helix-turn-helix domain-containing protein [Streptomyces sp. NBC_00102]
MTESTTGTADVPLPPPKERRRLREAKSLTEEQVASAVGVTPATVRSWESGRTAPRGRKRAAYAQLIGCAGRRPGRRRPSAPPAGPHPPTSPAPSSRPSPPADAAPSSRPSPRADSAPSSRAAAPGAADATAPPLTVAATGSTPMSPTEPDLTPSPDQDAPDQEVPARAAPAGEDGAAPAPVAPDPDAPAGPTPEGAFDALYRRTAPGLVGQAFLLTGRRGLSRESVERAFHTAWERWPEVAVDRDPAGWVRAAAHEYALSPWHRVRRAHRHPDKPPADPERRATLEAFLALPPASRRTVLLYDGVGLDLPETAAETEASTPAAAGRLVNARAALTERLPELAGAPSSTELSALLRERLHSLAAVEPAPALPTPKAVRAGSERKAQLWTRAAIAFAALLIGATAFTLHTAPTRYEEPLSPAERVGGVPPRGGPQQLTEQDLELQASLREELVHGPERLVPLPH